MPDASEIQRLRELTISAMQLSTDHLTAAGSDEVAAFPLASLAECRHLTRCIAAFTTDNDLVRELGEILGETTAAMIGKVESARFAPALCTGEHNALEKLLWTRLYAGRRERSRVVQMMTRRCGG